MKNAYSLFILLFLSLSSFGRTYHIYTAKKDGNWNNSGTWNVAARNDNVPKDKFIIPEGIVVNGDDDVNSMGYDDVEMQIQGTLKLGPSSSLHFGNSSKIELFETGTIEATGASQQIYIGSVIKYTGNKNKTLQGPVYADFSTGIAPQGFSNYSVLPVSFTDFSANLNDHVVTLKWSAANDKNSVYRLEQLANGKDWIKVALMQAEDNDDVHEYNFEDKSPPAGFICYRLKQVNADGKFQYSNTVSVRLIESKGEASISTSNKTVTIQLPAEAKTVGVKIMNMNGHVLVSQLYNRPSSKLSIDVGNINTGDYVVYVSENNNIETIRQLFIN